MRYSLQIIFLLVSFSIIISGQVPRTVLMEYATNASCGPCAYSNPDSYKYLSGNYGQMVSIWYHSWWPGSDDPMYLANIDENTNRINYYNIQGVPRFVVDGVLQGYADDQAALVTHSETRMQIESPLEMIVNCNVANDTVYADVLVNVLGEIDDLNLKLRIAIIEQMKIYDTPPGSNGEIDFPHVFRKFMEGIQGFDLGTLNVGDSVSVSLTQEVDPQWNIDEIAIVAFVQAPSKEIIQAATDRKLHSIKSDSPDLEFVGKEEAKQFNYSITNYQRDSLKLRIRFNNLENSENWPAVLKSNDAAVDSFDITLAPAEAVPFTMEVATTNDPGHIKLNVSAQNIGGETDYTSEINYMSLLTAGDIVLIDDDGGADYEKNFARALNNLDKEFTKIEHEILDEVKNEIEFSPNYQVIFWNMGEHAPSLEGKDITLLLSYLNNGGRAFFSGSDFAHDIHDVQKLSTGKFFFRNYLDANYLTDSVSSTSLETVEGNLLFETDIIMQINPIYSTLPDGVTSGKGQSYLTLKYDDTLHYGMLTRELNEYKTAYLTCGLEQIASVDDQNLIIEKVLDWFSKPVVGVEENEAAVLPTIFEIEQNFPNPFNPSTTIRFALPKSTFVSISVFNCLGEKVSELMNSELNAGFHSISFNAENLSSGIYFYRIIADEYIATKKMMLLK